MSCGNNKTNPEKVAEEDLEKVTGGFFVIDIPEDPEKETKEMKTEEKLEMVESDAEAALKALLEGK